jgi:hypothetical protein
MLVAEKTLTMKDAYANSNSKSSANKDGYKIKKVKGEAICLRDTRLCS